MNKDFKIEEARLRGVLDGILRVRDLVLAMTKKNKDAGNAMFVAQLIELELDIVREMKINGVEMRKLFEDEFENLLDQRDLHE